jgi:hypothetical protein
METIGNLNYERIANVCDNYILDSPYGNFDVETRACVRFIMNDTRVTDRNFFVPEDLLEQLVDEYFNL